MPPPLAFVLLVAHAAAQAPADEAALTQLVQHWVSARNAHDAEAMRSVFDQQVDQIRLTDGEVIAADQDGLVRWFDAGFAPFQRQWLPTRKAVTVGRVKMKPGIAV